MTRPFRITVGVDAEPPSGLAVDWAIRHALLRPSAITLVSSFDLLVTDPLEGEAILKSHADRIRAAIPGAPIATELVDRSIQQTLLGSAEDADLLVIGSHRSRHGRSVLSGDLPLAIAESASCPVVIVPDDIEIRGDAIAVGLDDDASSDAAVVRAAELAAAAGRELHVLHAWLRPRPAADPVGFYQKAPPALKSRHAARLAEVVQGIRAQHPGLSVSEHLYEGAAMNGLLAVAARCGLVVVGSHRRGPASRLVLGSVARDLLHFSRVPVCVVPPVAAEVPTGRAEFDEARA